MSHSWSHSCFDSLTTSSFFHHKSSMIDSHILSVSCFDFIRMYCVLKLSKVQQIPVSIRALVCTSLNQASLSILPFWILFHVVALCALMIADCCILVSCIPNNCWASYTLWVSDILFADHDRYFCLSFCDVMVVVVSWVVNFIDDSETFHAIFTAPVLTIWDVALPSGSIKISTFSTLLQIFVSHFSTFVAMIHNLASWGNFQAILAVKLAIHFASHTPQPINHTIVVIPIAIFWVVNCVGSPNELISWHNLDQPSLVVSIVANHNSGWFSAIAFIFALYSGLLVSLYLVR